MDTPLLRDLVREYINAASQKEAYEIYIHIEFYLVKIFIEDYINKNGNNPPVGFENGLDIRSAAETAICLQGGFIWHE